MFVAVPISYVFSPEVNFVDVGSNVLKLSLLYPSNSSLESYKLELMVFSVASLDFNISIGPNLFQSDDPSASVDEVFVLEP